MNSVEGDANSAPSMTTWGLMVPAIQEQSAIYMGNVTVNTKRRRFRKDQDSICRTMRPAVIKFRMIRWTVLANQRRQWWILLVNDSLGMELEYKTCSLDAGSPWYDDQVTIYVIKWASRSAVQMKLLFLFHECILVLRLLHAFRNAFDNNGFMKKLISCCFIGSCESGQLES